MIICKDRWNIVTKTELCLYELCLFLSHYVSDVSVGVSRFNVVSGSVIFLLETDWFWQRNTEKSIKMLSVIW